MFNGSLLDAQTAQAFLISQLTYVESEVYKIKYPEIRYPALVPVDTSANEWIPSVTYYSFDITGQANWFNGRAQDVPNANVLRSKFETPVKMGAIGYEWTLEELSQAQLLRRNLPADKGDAARFAAEQFIDSVAMFGDPVVGLSGLLNNPTVTVAQSPATGTGGSTLWATKTPDQITAEINGILTGVYSGSNTVEMADTLLLPIPAFTYINSTRLGNTNSDTILTFIRQNNIYTARTGRPLMIEGVRGLDVGGAGGTGRAVAYKRDPRVVKMHMPMPFKFMSQPYQVAPITWHVPGIFRVAGVDIRRPGAFRYLDGME
jgi:hypothetical protein